jgi:beta-galactosidase
VISALDVPILDELRPELDLSRSRRPEPKVAITELPLVHEGAFEPGSGVQEVLFTSPVRGRYVGLQTLNAHDGRPFAAIAEIALLDPSGAALSAESWKVEGVDSEERIREDGTAENAIDGQTANFWHTEWGAAQPGHPHWLLLDLGDVQQIGGFRYTPRQGGPRTRGRIKDYRIRVGAGAAD